MGVWRKNAPRRGSSQCKDPEAQECLSVKRTGRESGQLQHSGPGEEI